MNKEYIDKTELLEKVKAICGCFATPLIIRAIEDAKVEDVVEVVRCKNCIEFIPTNSCGGLCGLDYHQVNCESFCSDGNRK